MGGRGGFYPPSALLDPAHSERRARQAATFKLDPAAKNKQKKSRSGFPRSRALKVGGENSESLPSAQLRAAQNVHINCAKRPANELKTRPAAGRSPDGADRGWAATPSRGRLPLRIYHDRRRRPAVPCRARQQTAGIFRDRNRPQGRARS